MELRKSRNKVKSIENKLIDAHKSDKSKNKISEILDKWINSRKQMKKNKLLVKRAKSRAQGTILVM